MVRKAKTALAIDLDNENDIHFCPGRGQSIAKNSTSSVNTIATHTTITTASTKWKTTTPQHTKLLRNTTSRQLLTLNYFNRLNEYNNANIANPHPEFAFWQQPILAYKELPIDVEQVQEALVRVAASASGDFDIIVLIQILFLSDHTRYRGEYDELILPTLQAQSYWYESGKVIDKVMHSENHMIAWMSSAWLLHERQGWDMGSTLHQRLLHYLNLKIEYGYYEFLSASYWPITFHCLLNLANFCTDTTMRDLAEAAVRRLVTDQLVFFNDKGLKFSVSGRDFPHRYIEGSSYQHTFLYLITGMGEKREEITRHSSSLTTSLIDFSDLVGQWRPSIDKIYKYGHTLQESFDINKYLNKWDRIPFQWSQGAYLHPDVAEDSIEFIQRYGPITFTDGIRIHKLADLVPASLAARPVATKFLSHFLGSILSGFDIPVFRDGGVVLSSVSDFWPGMAGFQAFPWMAVVDDSPVFTSSGKVRGDWRDRGTIKMNSHLPSVVQKSNVAMIAYKPFKPMLLMLEKDVALYWENSKFDEIKTVGGANINQSEEVVSLWSRVFGIFSIGQSLEDRWLLGRVEDSYVAIYRPCGSKTKKGWFTCSGETFTGRQVWASVVGTSSTHGSFESFAAVIETAVVSETSSWFSLFWKNLYEIRVEVDNKILELQW